MIDLLKKTIWLGTGLVVMTKEKIEAVVDELIQKGQFSEKEGKDLATELIARSLTAKKELGEKIDKMISETLKRLNIPTRKDLEDLKTRLERLERTLEKKE